MDRVHARMAARAKMPTGFASQPEPRTIGRYARGRQLVAGNFLFSGHLIEAPGRAIWDIVAEAPHIAAELQGCTWLDDLAAVGDAKARERAQAWVFDWIDRFGQGRGPGWTPDLTGRRLIRWINHGFFLLRGQEKAAADKFFLSLARQTLFLSRRWRSARPGLPRFEALTGLIYAGLSLEGMEAHVDPAIAELTRDCERQVSEGGGIPTRNPEELLEVLTLLNWAVQAQSEAGRGPPAPQLAAIARIAPTLRTLRHADGGLARFHGGGRGIDGWLDHALATAATPGIRRDDLAMGFARMAAGRTSVIVDAAPPPMGPASVDAHASTNAFELTSGRRPMIVNCGSGRSFGPDWRRAGRATPSHSTLGLAAMSSSRLGALDGHDGRKAEELVEVPDRVPAIFSRLPDGRRLEVAHNGYQRTHGLTHARTLDLSFDGRALAGEDLLTTLSDGDKARFDRAMDAARLDGIAFAIRFHLHPEVDASVDLGGAAVSLALKSGEVWIFRQDGSATMTLEPSVYLENGRLRPRNAQQVVLSGHAMSYATRVRWYLAKAQDTPDGLRDLGQNDSDMLADDA
ncbi:MAG: heparinase [Limimaricola sp.]|uniref:heparinase II/III family protein n=1 Tax=Limimaricola sp. TaxID=2211665 RepID=UPI001D55FDEA|nr:heparinase II/III family protein [Limimaricola sp.]MBI1416958.1 heparinase [Limimaricola sp.]